MKKIYTIILTALLANTSIHAQCDTLTIGYGDRVSKHETSLAIDGVSAEQLGLTNSFNPMNNLYGLIPGLLVRQGSPEPWSSYPTLSVRGKSSMNGNAPLIIIDGVERDPNLLNTEEIQSITVLKDAASTALYGNRAADGVIIITTKSGSSQKMKVSANYNFGVQTAFRVPEMASGAEYANAVNEALRNDGLPTRYSQRDIAALASGGETKLSNVDWQDEILRGAGFTNDFNLSVNGRNDKLSYFVLAGYNGNSGLLDNTQLNDGYSTQIEQSALKLRSNIEASITALTKARFRLMGRILQHQSPYSGTSLATMYNTPAIAFPIYLNGKFVSSTLHSNPVATLGGSGYTTVVQRSLYADMELEQDLRFLTEGLSASISVSYDNSADITDSRSKTFRYYNIDYTRNASGSVTDYALTELGNETSIAFSSYLSYQLMRSNVSARLNYEREFGALDLKSAAIFNQTKVKYLGAGNTAAYRDFIASASLSYDKRLFMTLTANCSGSAKLPSGDKYRLYPAASLAYIISREPFVKIRGSYGVSGYDQYLSYDMDKQFNGSGNSFSFNGSSTLGGLAQGALPSTDIEPERSYKSDLGIELGLWDNRLSVQADVFYDIRKNQMVSSSGIYSTVIGLATPYIFTGEARNYGAELSLKWDESIGELRYHIAGNLTFARNKVIEMAEEYHPHGYMNLTGHSIDTFYGYESDGFYLSSDFNADGSLREGVVNSTLVSELKPGDVKYKDLNDDGRIDRYDCRYFDGKSLFPELWFGLNIGASYKGFGFEAIFSGEGDHVVVTNLPSVYQPLFNGDKNISKHYLADYWSEGMIEARYPRLTTLSNNNNFAQSDLWLENGAFAKLRDLYLYYKPGDNFTIYLRGTNLFSIDSIGIFDPEYISLGYPSVKTFQAGIKCLF